MLCPDGYVISSEKQRIIYKHYILELYDIEKHLDDKFKFPVIKNDSCYAFPTKMEIFRKTITNIVRSFFIIKTLSNNKKND